ncbi:glycosyltransferase [Sphingomonas sp. AP4-R1]|uniref:glycosyltransferase n=1 Tax=Sphingomonas sp. AP4-R1 TaxID=2735134 RepID=UPI001493944F|nr:glycosyltransferase [Sphingomonas sp. AP4-R1]QJU57553.1 glycosyltransferase [Sphingomonas sp. AP4-R1]
MIVYVHDLRSSGVVRNAIDHAALFARTRPTTLVVGYDVGMFREEAKARGFALHVLGDRPGRFARATAARRLRRWLRDRPADILLSEGNLGHPSCYWATRGLGHIARVYCISQEVKRADGWKSALRRRWVTMLARDAARLVLVGTANRGVPMLDRMLASGRAVEAVNAVDVDHARAMARAPAPHPWLGDPDVPVIVTVGRLRPQKNHDLLIAGVAQARATKRMRLVIIGGGAEAERARLTALAEAAGLSEDFLLAGETTNVFAWLARAHVFALTSRWEGSSITLLEALAVGAPLVVSARAGDAVRVLEEGRHGRLFDGYDPAALAQALLDQVSPRRTLPDAWRPDAGDAVIYERIIDDLAAERSA